MLHLLRLQTTDVFSIGFFDELLDQYIGIYTFKGIDYTSQLLVSAKTTPLTLGTFSSSFTYMEKGAQSQRQLRLSAGRYPSHKQI
jgi:hypothetical protein